MSDDELALIREEAARIADDWAEQQPTEPTRKEADAEFVRAILRLCANAPQADAISREAGTPRFSVTYCSQCGQEFGPGNSGFSHCRNHRGMARAQSQRDSQAVAAPSEAKRGTDAQILFERKLTCEAINGAIAFGYRNANPPPSDDHWLAPFWKIGRKHAELEAAIAAGGAQEPIYQTCFIQGQWRDVDRAEYDRAKGLRADLARIVYAAPLPRVAATVKLMSDDEIARFFHAIYGTRGFPITVYGARELVHGLQHWLAAPAAANGEKP